MTFGDSGPAWAKGPAAGRTPPARVQRRRAPSRGRGHRAGHGTCPRGALAAEGSPGTRKEESAVILTRCSAARVLPGRKGWPDAATAPGRPRPAGLVASTAGGVQADSRPCAGRWKTAACFLGRRGCILTFLQESGGPRHSPGRAGGTFASFSLSHKETAFVFNHRRKSYCSWADRGNLDVKIKYKERKIKRNLLTLSQARYPVFGLCF